MTTPHRIDELLFELAFESPTMAIARAEELRSLVVDKLLPLIERVFDQFDEPDVVWQIDQLEVDVGDVAEAELPAALVAGLRQALAATSRDNGVPAGSDTVMPSAAAPNSPTRRIESARAASDMLLGFLADGILPWQMDATAGAAHEVLLAQVLQQGSGDFLQALAASPHRAVMLARLVRQFTPARLRPLLHRMNPGQADTVWAQLAAVQTLLQDSGLARTLSGGALHAAWEAAFALILDQPDLLSRQWLSTALTGRTLTWLAEQQRQDVAVLATQLLRKTAMLHAQNRAFNDVLDALRKLAGARLPLHAETSDIGTLGPQFDEHDLILPSGRPEGDADDVAKAIVPAALAAVLGKASEVISPDIGGPVAAVTMLPSATLSVTDGNSPLRDIAPARAASDMLLSFLADGILPQQMDAPARGAHEVLLEQVLQQGAGDFLQALMASPHRRVMLARLVRQFAPARLQPLLYRMNPGQADTVWSQLEALKTLLQESGLWRTLSDGALHAVREEAFALILEQPDLLSRQSLLTALLGRTLTWLAEQQGQDVVVLATRLLQKTSMLHGQSRAFNDVLDALRKLAGAGLSLPAKKTDAENQGQQFDQRDAILQTDQPESHSQLMPMASARTASDMLLRFLTDGRWSQQMGAPAGVAQEVLLAQVQQQGSGDFLQALAVSPHRTVMLARLVRQFAPVRLQPLLHRMNPVQADAVRSQLEVLKTLLQDSGLAGSLLDGALHAAWEAAFDLILDQPDLLSRQLLSTALLGRTLTWLAEQQRQSIATLAMQLLQKTTMLHDQSRAFNDVLDALRRQAGAGLPLLAEISGTGTHGHQVNERNLNLQIDQPVGDVSEAALLSAPFTGLREENEVIPPDTGDLIAANTMMLSGAGGSLAPVHVASDMLLRFLADGIWPQQTDAPAGVAHEVLLTQVLQQDGGDFLSALAASPQRPVMLARLVRQFAPARLQPLLHRMHPGQADAVWSQLEALKILLQDSGLARTLSDGALHAAWEEAFARLLDQPDLVSRQSLPSALLSRTLTWLAEQQRQDVAVLATQLLQKTFMLHGQSRAFNDVLDALRKLAGVELSLSIELPGKETREIQERTQEKPQDEIQKKHATPDMPVVLASPLPIAGSAAHAAGTAEELPQEWLALLQHPDDPVLLARLLQQSSVLTLQAMLRHFNPLHGAMLLAQLDGLQQILARLSLSSQTLQAAWLAAWEAAFSTSLTQPSRVPAILPMLERTVAVLVAQMPTDAGADAPLAATARQRRARVLTQSAEAGVAAGDPAGMATAFLALQGMPEMAAVPPASAEVSASLVAPLRLDQEVGVQAGGHSSADSQVSPSELVSLRNRVTAALMGGKTGEIYDDWRKLRDSRPDLLRSAIRHYGGYGDIRTTMASSFPLSLLLDMQALLAPDAARLTALVWNDVWLRTRPALASAAQWRHWCRNWWLGAFSYLLQMAEAPEGSTGFDPAAYAVAALSGAGVVAATDEIGSYVAALVQGRAPQWLQYATSAQQTMPATVPATESLPEVRPATAIAVGTSLSSEEQLQQLEQLEQQVRDAVREPTFYKAIADHAAAARDRRRYYRQVLQALAQNRIVDLEAFAADEEMQVPTTELLPDTPSSDALVAATVEVDVAGVIAATAVTPDNRRQIDERDQAQLASHLATALMQGEPSLLYEDWDVLLHAHAPLLEEALRHYGRRDDILQRIVASFPESMLYDMALLLAPAAQPAWRQLRDHVAWTAMVDGSPAQMQAIPPSVVTTDAREEAQEQEPFAPAPVAEALAAWKRQLWHAALGFFLRGTWHDDDQSGNHNDAVHAATGEDGSVSLGALHRHVPVAESGTEPGAESGAESVQALMSALASDASLAGTAWQRRLLMRWVQMSSRNDDTQPVSQRIPVAATEPVVQASALMAAAQIRPVADDVSIILQHHQTLMGNGNVGTSAPASNKLPSSSAADELQAAARVELPETLPDTTRAGLLQCFARLRNDPRQIDTVVAAADLEHLVEAHVIAHSVDLMQPQTQIFAHAIKAQAPLTHPLDRARYFKAVLHALLQEQMLDLEEIAEASLTGPDEGADADAVALNSTAAVDSNVVGNNATPSPEAGMAAEAEQASSPESSQPPAPASQGYVDFLLAKDFAAGAALPSGLFEWLRHSIDTAAPQLVPVLTQLSQSPEAVTRLLALLPAASWQPLLAIAPTPALQVRRLLRYAGDVSELFAEQNQQLPAAELERFERRFLLPYLFAAERIFEPLRFTNELVGFLTRACAVPAPPGLAARLRSQLGLVVSPPRALQRTVPGMSADANTNGVSGNGRDASGHPKAAQSPADDDALLTFSGIHVINAGMVLTWPFLSRAWDLLGLTQENRFIDQDAAQRAAWLLQFMVDEQTALPEYQLPLNKLLCGIHLQAPIVPDIEVTEQERDVIVQLLTVMITHWKSIGNTSIDGLRETFLKREGYLSRKEDGWHLEIPKKTFDMLLEKLPWSIGTIRLPWMNEILWVKWV